MLGTPYPGDVDARVLDSAVVYEAAAAPKCKQNSHRHGHCSAEQGAPNRQAQHDIFGIMAILAGGSATKSNGTTSHGTPL